ncbi:MAG: hypothetical protein WHV61_02975, partial [Burkholderiales bacterium]
MSEGRAQQISGRSAPRARPTDAQWIASFDYLRLFAMGLVTVQHALSVAGYYADTTWNNVNCQVPDDHMAACETDVDACDAIPSWL